MELVEVVKIRSFTETPFFVIENRAGCDGRGWCLARERILK